MTHFDPTTLPDWQTNQQGIAESTCGRFQIWQCHFDDLPSEWQLSRDGIVIGTFPLDIDTDKASLILRALDVTQ